MYEGHEFGDATSDDEEGEESGEEDKVRIYNY